MTVKHRIQPITVYASESIRRESSKRMANGKRRTTRNLDVNIKPSYATTMRSGIGFSMAVCTLGSRRGDLLNRWETDGDCRRTTDGGRWRTNTVGSRRFGAQGCIQGTPDRRHVGIQRHTLRSAPMIASVLD